MAGLEIAYISHVETVVKLSKGDIDRDGSERKNAVKTSDTGMVSGYSKGNKAPETNRQIHYRASFFE